MMLLLLVIVGIVAAVVIAAAVRRNVLHAWAAVPLVTAVPLLGWLAIQATADVARSPWEFQVLGQYHRLVDTLTIGTEPAGPQGSDVALQGSSLPDTRVHVAYAGGADSIRVTVERSTQPVIAGNTPVNAARIGRRASVANADATVEIVRPWYCIRCDTRVVRPTGSARYEIRIGSAARVPLGGDTVTVFRADGDTWVAADPAAGVTVGGTAIPTHAVVRSDTLHFGVPAIERVHVAASAADHRIDVRFAGRASSRSWPLPLVDADSTLALLVATTNGDAVPGTMRVINPAAAAPGAATEPYGGMLQQSGDGWDWVAGGSTRAFETGAVERLPGGFAGRTRGHLVSLRQTDTHPGSARIAVIIAWLAGTFALAWSMRLLHPEPLALRIFLLGGVYTLVAVRGTLAFRAWLAPPHDTNSPVTFLALLLALPALAALLHAWHTISSGALGVNDRRREAIITLAPVVVAAVAVALLVLPDWRLEILRTAAATVIIGAGGLALLNRMLLTGSTDARRTLPVAAVAAPVHEGYTQRQFLSALAMLGVLAFLLLVVTELVKFGTLLALMGWGVILALVLLATSSPRALIRAPSPISGNVLAVLAAVAAGGLALLLGRGFLVAAVALVGAGALTLALVRRRSVRLRPVHLRDLAGPPLTLAMGIALVAVLVPGLVSSLRVLAEYALAIAGLVVIARIFAILWFRHTQQLSARRHGPALRGPHAFAIAAVLMVLAAVIYIPLAVFDTGLVLLFFAATVTAVFAGFFMIGARVLAGGIAVAVVIAFVAGMFVRRADLVDGSASLNTAQIRYAATYHPDALQRHMLATQDGRPITTVRTLQQYWGMSHYAAGGTAGRGYFGNDYADWIVPRPVALTENVFSAFVLSEHGWAGGAAVLFCYLMIALALLYGAWRACSRTQTAPRALLLVGIAAFWIVPAFYIAAANGVLVPLTGQNMPMLGLLSSADAALAVWLAAIGLVALPGESESGAEHVRSGGWTKRLRTAVVSIAGLFAFACTAIIALLWKPAHATVDTFRLDRVVADVEALVDQGALVPVTAGPDTVAVAQAGARHPLLRDNGFLRDRIARANMIARGEGAGASCLDSDALVRVRDDGGIAVFSALCSLRTLVEGRRDWAGSLRTETEVATFAITDGRTSVILDPAATDDAVIGTGCSVAGVTRARTVRIGCDDSAAAIRFGTTAPLLQQAGSVLVNGQAPTVPAMLADGDHLRAADAADVWVTATPPGAVAYPRWENGAARRIHSPLLQPWVAQVDTQLARGLAAPERADWHATLTLRPQLQSRLHRALEEACAAAPGVRRCSAVIADPNTGAVLALSATFSQPHRYLPADANLRNHPAASTIKPVIAAAAVHAFPSLRTLEVGHSAAEYEVIANTPLQPPVRAARMYPAPLVPWAGYLGASDNLYAITLGFLAASDAGGAGGSPRAGAGRAAVDSPADAGAPDNAGALPAMRGSASQSVMRVNGSALRGQPSWTAARPNLERSPLAVSMEALYGVEAATAEASPYDTGFWNAAVEAGAIVASGDVQRITPEPVVLGLDRVDSPRAFAAFLLGGGTNRWNNVALVQAFSRIYSGRAVNLHVLKSVGPHSLAAEPTSLDAMQQPREAVLEGLDAVVEQPWGTGRSLRGVFAPGVTWRAKTGTLQEREWNGSVFLWAGSGRENAPGVCAAAGILTLEMTGNASPDGRATAMFRDAIAPILQQELGWGTRECVR